jgi:hypothetical protein
MYSLPAHTNMSSNINHTFGNGLQYELSFLVPLFA